MWRTIQASLGVLLFAVAGTPLAAVVSPIDQSTCPSGLAPVGGLGIVDLFCEGQPSCHPKGADGLRDPRFVVEPVVGGVEKDRPADGALIRGDVLLAVDGLPLTTSEGGRRFSQLPPDQPVVLKVRRDGVVREVRIVTDRECKAIPPAPQPPRRPAPPAPPAAPAQPKARAAGVAGAAAPGRPAAPLPPKAPAPPAPPDVAPYARLGFSFECGNCGFRPDVNGSRSWVFVDLPVVSQVEPGGPAAASGLQPGDRLVQIDGV